MPDIEFTRAEWEAANNLAVKLLEALGPQRIALCDECGTSQALLPNYQMKYHLAKAVLFGAYR